MLDCCRFFPAKVLHLEQLPAAATLGVEEFCVIHAVGKLRPLGGLLSQLSRAGGCCLVELDPAGKTAKVDLSHHDTGYFLNDNNLPLLARVSATADGRPIASVCVSPNPTKMRGVRARVHHRENWVKPALTKTWPKNTVKRAFVQVQVELFNPQTPFCLSLVLCSKSVPCRAHKMYIYRFGTTPHTQEGLIAFLSMVQVLRCYTQK